MAPMDAGSASFALNATVPLGGWMGRIRWRCFTSTASSINGPARAPRRPGEVALNATVPSDSTTMDRSWPRPSDESSSPCPAVSHADRGDHSFTCRRSGHGLPNGLRASTASGHCLFEPERHTPGWPTKVQSLPSRSQRLTFWSVTSSLLEASRNAADGVNRQPEMTPSPVHPGRFGGSRFRGRADRL